MRTGALVFEQRVSSRRERGTHGPGLESGRRSLFSRHPFNLRFPTAFSYPLCLQFMYAPQQPSTRCFCRCGMSASRISTLLYRTAVSGGCVVDLCEIVSSHNSPSNKPYFERFRIPDAHPESIVEDAQCGRTERRPGEFEWVIASRCRSSSISDICTMKFIVNMSLMLSTVVQLTFSKS